MPTISTDAKEAVEGQFAIYETERQTHLDEIAELTLRAEAAEAEIKRIKTEYPDVV